MASIRHLYVDAGADYSNIITISSSVGGVLDLTGYTVKSQMRKSYTSTVYHNFTAQILNPLDGQVQLRLTAAQSELIPPGRWLYDVEITNTASGYKTRVIEGIVTVTPQITQI